MSCFVGATEHPSVLAGGRFPPDAVRQIPVDETGVVDLAALKAMLLQADREGKRALVSVMLANNETGAIQPVAEVARHRPRGTARSSTPTRCRRRGASRSTSRALGVDVLTLSAHKIGGPQGAGAIVRASEDLAFAPLLTGGGQERRLRAGTENVAAIAGFGAAATAALADLDRAGDWAALARPARGDRRRRRQGDRLQRRRRRGCRRRFASPSPGFRPKRC